MLTDGQPNPNPHGTGRLACLLCIQHRVAAGCRTTQVQGNLLCCVAIIAIGLLRAAPAKSLMQLREDQGRLTGPDQDPTYVSKALTVCHLKPLPSLLLQPISHHSTEPVSQWEKKEGVAGRRAGKGWGGENREGSEEVNGWVRLGRRQDWRQQCCQYPIPLPGPILQCGFMQTCPSQHCPEETHLPSTIGCSGCHFCLAASVGGYGEDWAVIHVTRTFTTNTQHIFFSDIHKCFQILTLPGIVNIRVTFPIQ